MRPIAIPKYISQHDQDMEILMERTAVIRSHTMRMYSLTPDVSIIIPAYNEEAGILKTLSSLSASTTKRSVEIIVVNNNSTDKTAELALATGVRCINEDRQGITFARNAGLRIANGKYILNADSDTIYPPAWIDTMLDPLTNESIVVVYGSFSFIPGSGKLRVTYFGYEYLSDFSKWINKKFREEAVNVYGFNSGFRRSEGISVGGFDHPEGTNEDGWLALKLRNKFKKKLYPVTDRRAMAWTSDRRIQSDGGIYKAFFNRMRRYVSSRKS